MSAPAHSGLAVDADLRTVARFLDDYFARQIARADTLGEPYRGLWEATRDAAAGGKRFRPALLLLAYRHLSEDDDPLPTDAVQLAAATELLHTALVIHDDVIDHDLVRRGGPNVAGRAVMAALDAGAGAEAARSYGEASAILAGDLLISSAHTLVAGLSAPAERRRALLALLDECMFRTAAGEHADVWAAVTGAPSEQTVLAVVENKTAAYSFSTPLQAGAILAGASTRTLEGLRRLGQHLGIAFQLRDDVLGTFGDELATGKTATGDLREGKETLLISYARSHRRWEDVADLFGRPDLDERSADLLRRAIRDAGALRRVEQRIRHELRLAETLLTDLGLPDPFRDAILTITGPAGARRR